MNKRNNISCIKGNRGWEHARSLEALRISHGQPGDLLKIGCIASDDLRLLKQGGGSDDCVGRFKPMEPTNADCFVNNAGKNGYFFKLRKQFPQCLVIVRAQAGITQRFEPGHCRKANPDSLRRACLDENELCICFAGMCVNPNISIEQPAHQRLPRSRRSRSSHSARASCWTARPSTLFCIVPSSSMTLFQSGPCPGVSSTVSNAFPVAGNLSGSSTV